MGHAGCKWNYVTDSKRKRATVFPSPPIQVMEARAWTQSDKHPGPQLPHPSTEREALRPISPDQRALSEGTASRWKNAPASVDAEGLVSAILKYNPGTASDWVLLPCCFSSLWGKSAKKPASVSVLCTVLWSPYWYRVRVYQGDDSNSKWEGERWPKSWW